MSSQDYKENRDLKKSKKNKSPPKIQHAQKCPYCNKYLLVDQSITIYSGTDDDFIGWLVHEECQT